MNLHVKDTAAWLGNPYELFRWLLSILVAGVVSIVPYSVISDYYLRSFVSQSLLQPPPVLVNGTLPTSYPVVGLTMNEYGWLAFGFVIAFLIGIVLSLGMSRLVPDRKIVPPFFMMMIVLAWFVYSGIFLSGQYLNLVPPGPNAYAYQLAILRGIPLWYFTAGTLLLTVGVVQDSAVTAILGISAQDDNIVRISMRVFASPEDVKNLLMLSVVKDRLALSRKFDKKVDGTIYLWRSSRRRYVFQIQLKPTKAVRNGAELVDTIMSVVGFERRQYYITTTAPFRESFVGDIAYIETVFKRTPKPTEYSIEPESNAQQLVDEAIEELRGGISPHFERLSTLGWVKLILLVAGFGISGFFFYTKDYTSALILIGSAVLYLAVELPSRIRARGE